MNCFLVKHFKPAAFASFEGCHGLGLRAACVSPHLPLLTALQLPQSLLHMIKPVIFIRTFFSC